MGFLKRAGSKVNDKRKDVRDKRKDKGKDRLLGKFNMLGIINKPIVEKGKEIATDAWDKLTGDEEEVVEEVDSVEEVTDNSGLGGGMYDAEAARLRKLEAKELKDRQDRMKRGFNMEGGGRQGLMFKRNQKGVA